MEETTNKISPYLWVTVILGTLFILAMSINLLENLFSANLKNLLSNAIEVKDLEEYEISNEALISNVSPNSVKLYHFFNNEYFNDVFEFNYKGSNVYKFSVETDLNVGNDGSKFSYEVGRIYVNPNNPNKSKCTYNYMAEFSNEPVKYFECTENDFIKSLPKISALKKEKFEEYKSALEMENKLDICGYGDMENEPQCQFLKGKNWDIEYEKNARLKTEKLKNLRCATL